MEYIPLEKPVKKLGKQTPTKKISSTTIDIILSSSVNGIIQVDKIKAELAQCLSGSWFNPVPSTFIRAIIRNHFTSWPSLTGNLISKRLPKVEAIVKGRLDQEQKNIWSTTHADLLNTNKNIEAN